MAQHRFSSENQPENRGRKEIPEEDRKVSITTCVHKDCKEWYGRRYGLAAKVLEDYYKSQIK